MKFTFETTDPRIAALISDLLAGRNIDNGEVPADMSVRDLGLSVRTQNILLSEGFDSVAAVLNSRRSELMSAPNMGIKSLRELEDCLALRGWRLNP